MRSGSYATEGDKYMGIKRLLRVQEKVAEAVEMTDKSIARLEEEQEERAELAAELRLIETELSNIVEERQK